MTKFQNISREELVIRRIYDDAIIQNKVITHLDPELFSDETNKTLCRAMIAGYEKYGRFPQSQETNLALGENTIEKNKFLKIMNYKVDDLDREMCIDIIETFFKEKKTQTILEEAAEMIGEKDFSNIAPLIKNLQESVNFSLYMDIGLDLKEDADEALRRLNETHKPIPSAITEIRSLTCGDLTTGGWYRSAISVFQGMPNVGKTIFLCNEAAFSYQSGFNTLYVSLELAEELIWERIACNITDIPLYQIRKEAAGDIEALLEKNKEEHATGCGTMVVRQLPSTTNALDIENLINEIKVSKGITIDIVFIDYLGKMKPAKRDTGTRDTSLYTQGKEVTEQLRDLAVKYEIPIVTASQVNRDGYGNTQSDMKNTAGSAGVNDTADLMITITQDPMLKQEHLYLHTIIKNRFGPNTESFITHCDYAHMRVRSANPDQVQTYRDSQMNQDASIPNFNTGGNTINSANLKKIQENKSEFPTPEEQEEIRRQRFHDLKDKYEKEEQKENILDTDNDKPDDDEPEAPTSAPEPKPDDTPPVSRWDAIRAEREQDDAVQK